MAYKTVTTENELNELLKEGTVFVDFYADWCGPCKMLAPFFEELSNEETGVTFAKINTDNSQELAQKFGIVSIPTLITFENGEIKNRHVGFASKDQMKTLIK